MEQYALFTLASKELLRVNMQDQVASNIMSAYIALGERFNIVNNALYQRNNRLQSVQLENKTAVI